MVQNLYEIYVQKYCRKFIPKIKDKNKIWTKYQSKSKQNAYFHTIVCPICIHRKYTICTQSHWVTPPLKVDRGLQWMSHHPSNPTYNPMLSGTMTQLSARCQKQHHQETQYKHIHTKGLYQIFDILYANIVKIIYDIQYLIFVMQK